MRQQDPGVIRRNVDVIAIGVLLGGLALCSNARRIVFSDFVGASGVVFNRLHDDHFEIVSCPLSPSLVLR